MQRWGDEHVPPCVTLRRRSLSGDQELHVGFVDDPADLVPLENVNFEHLPTHPLHRAEATD